MNNYILLPRFQFTSFYKYGNLYIKHSDLVKADNDEPKLIEECLSLFKKLPYFEYEDEYIILKIDIDTPNNDDIYVSINQVQEIIVLSNQAKLSIQSKIDNRIHLSTYQWAEKVLMQIEQFYNKSLIEKGIDALWKISGFKENWRDEIFISEDLKNAILIGITERSFVKSRDKIQGSFISQAIVYDRTEFFPEGADGYLFDICEILCNHLETGFQFKQTELYHWLLDKYQSEQTNCWRTYSKDTSYEKLTNFKQTLYSKLPSDEIRWENAIAWYLSQKSNFQKKGQFDAFLFKSELNKNLDDFIAERKLAVIMLGAFFGYKYLYDALYDVLELPIFKKKVKTEIPQPQKEVTSFKHITVTQKPARKTTKPRNTISKENNTVTLVSKKETNELLFDFDKQNEKQTNTIVEIIAPIDKSDPVFEVTRIVEPNFEAKTNIFPSDKRGEIRAKIIEGLPKLKAQKESISWIIDCYEKYFFSENKSIALFKVLLGNETKPKPFGKKEIDVVVEFFVKEKLIK